MATPAQDFTDHIVDFLVDQWRAGKLTPGQVARLRGMFDPVESSTALESSLATTVKFPIYKVQDAE